MGESIIAGLLRGKLVEPHQIVGSEPRAERREQLASQYGVRMVASNLEAAVGADVILLSVKPQTLTKVGHELGGHLKPNQLVVSIVAGANCNVLTSLLNHREVVRSMPNTPAQIGRGITVWYATPEVTEVQRDQARVLLQALGADLQVEDEKFVEMATAVSGTGPAYVFLVMEALIDAAVHLGFPRHVAHDLVIETLEGSTAFAKATAQHPAVLRNMVTSPGGTSAAAIHELESGRLRTVLSEAVWASYRRTLELGADLEKGLGLNEGTTDPAAAGSATDGTRPNTPAARPLGR
jgi:pyrroline-5-carboxylate reductase